MRRPAAVLGGAALLAAVMLAACGVKGPPRPPAGATRAPGVAAQGSEPGSVAGADTAPATDCGPAAAREQGNER